MTTHRPQAEPLTVRLTPPPGAHLDRKPAIKQIGASVLLELILVVGGVVMFRILGDVGALLIWGSGALFFLAFQLPAVVRLPGMAGRIRLTHTPDALILTDLPGLHATTTTLTITAATTDTNSPPPPHSPDSPQPNSTSTGTHPRRHSRR